MIPFVVSSTYWKQQGADAWKTNKKTTEMITCNLFGWAVLFIAEMTFRFWGSLHKHSHSNTPPTRSHTPTTQAHKQPPQHHKNEWIFIFTFQYKESQGIWKIIKKWLCWLLINSLITCNNYKNDLLLLLLLLLLLTSAHWPSG